MADEQVVVKDDKVVASTSTASADSSATTPSGEKPEAKTSEAVPYDRFQEVIKQKNQEKLLREQYEARIRELENRQPNGTPIQDKVVQKLVASGMKPEAAQLIADTQRETMREAMAPLQAREKARSIEQWTKDIERSDPDYKKLKPELEKAFDGLSDDEKQFAVSSQKGLEWFYKSVKSDVLGVEIAKARAEGVKQGYESKSQKEGMANDPKTGTAPIAALTFESIRAGALRGMSDEDYKKRLPEINAVLAKGPTRK